MNVYSLRQPVIAGFLACVATSLFGQTPTTSSPYEPELNSIVLESKVDLANVKTPAPLPGEVVGILATGIVELRARLDKYDPVARTFRSTLYLAQPATAIPAPDALVPAPGDLTLVSQAVLRVESIYHVKGSPLSIGLAGRFATILGGSPQLPIPTGAPFLCSFSYPASGLSATGEPSATFGELSFLIPGQLNLYAPAPVGSITVTPPASN